jgi:hypothetical protein
VGAVYPPICGQVLCGQTLAATWTTTWGRPKEILQPRTLSVTITAGPLITLLVNRPKLLLNARSFAKQVDTTQAIGRPRLVLTPRVFTIPPFLVVPLTGKPKLILRSRAFVLGLSSSPAFGRPRLILLARALVRVGKPGLVPTVPQSATLTPTTPQAGVLTPTTPQTQLLTPTKVEVR